ncbi:MAG: RsmB/NOP family class I SAM-dependent RNA methyltransferase [Nanoarchaeota archaeon]
MILKNSFIERYKELTNFDEFMEINNIPLRNSLRVNTLKTTVKDMKARFMMKQVPWCDEGFFLESFALGNTPEHFMGYMYIQEAASMIPPVVLAPKEGDIILDIAAAPGSKTTQIAALTKNTGLIIANDVTVDRLKPLSVNLERCGVSNAVVTFNRGERIRGMQFDRILVDAPCSGIGAIRKSPKTIQMYNVNIIKKLAIQQKKLLYNSWKLLKKDGVLVYSTCTLEPEENEGVVDYLLENFDDVSVEKINLNIKSSKTVEEFNGVEYSSEVKKCLRIWPQDNDTEGFFVAKLKKV